MLTSLLGDTYQVWILNSIETLMGAMCASAPPLKVLFRRISRSRPGSTFFRYDPWGYNPDSLTSQESGRPDDSPAQIDYYQQYISSAPRRSIFTRNQSTATSSQTRVGSRASVQDDFNDQGGKTPRPDHPLELVEGVVHRSDEVGYELSVLWRPITPGLNIPLPEV